MTIEIKGSRHSYYACEAYYDVLDCIAKGIQCVYRHLSLWTRLSMSNYAEGTNT